MEILKIIFGEYGNKVLCIYLMAQFVLFAIVFAIDALPRGSPKKMGIEQILYLICSILCFIGVAICNIGLRIN